ncbi:MAG: hypothetical protein ACI970_001609, partial [Myxococcota bacterium]
GGLTMADASVDVPKRLVDVSVVQLGERSTIAGLCPVYERDKARIDGFRRAHPAT